MSRAPRCVAWLLIAESAKKPAKEIAAATAIGRLANVLLPTLPLWLLLSLSGRLP